MVSEKLRIFLGVFYFDFESYDCLLVLVCLLEVFEEWVYIIYDMDMDDNGEIKKVYIYWVGKFFFLVLFFIVVGGCKLGVLENFVEYCKNWKFVVCYLVYKDNFEKFQYFLEVVVSNFDIFFILDGKQSEIVKVRMICQYIEEM